MISALNMELDVIRTVLRNNVSEVSVCTDAKRDTGNYFTVVAIFSSAVSKELARRMAVSELFSLNRDFVGSFSHKGALNLVFAYRPESRIAGKEDLYAPTFVKRREIALNFLAALAETEIRGDIGRLLLTEENVNLTQDGKVYLNYFLNFEGFEPSDDQDGFYRAAADFAFGILAREYAAKYDGQIDMYPYELRLMYKKLQNKTFRSLSQIMAFVRTLPDKPAEQRFGIRRLAGAAEPVKDFFLKNPANFFLATVIAVTLVYLGYQLIIRVAAGNSVRENTVYVGMEQIGEIYLGEENV